MAGITYVRQTRKFIFDSFSVTGMEKVEVEEELLAIVDVLEEWIGFDTM
jgi:hypothetical protein